MSEKCNVDYLSFNPECPSSSVFEVKNRLKSGDFKFTYLDNNGTHPVLDEVIEEVLKSFKLVGNPSSNNQAGRYIRSLLESYREEIRDLLELPPGFKIIFTSCGSETNNMILKGINIKNKKIVISEGEHKSILVPADFLEKIGCRVVRVQLSTNGYVDENKLLDCVDSDTILVSIMLANNETGVITPGSIFEKIRKKNRDVIIHSDCSQVISKMNFSLLNTPIDIMTFTGHKFGGPIGIGLLCIKDIDIIEPLIHGGNQELKKRAGTYNFPLIAGFKKALELSKKFDHDKVSDIRNKMEKELKGINCKINGEKSDRLFNTSSIQFLGNQSEKLLMHLSYFGIQVSSGSACASFSNKPSHVLKSMGLTDEEANSTIRVSLNRFSNENEINFFIEKIKEYPGLCL